MKKRKIISTITLTIWILIIFTSTGWGQVKEGKDVVFFSGIVKEISWDHQSMIIQGKKCYVSNDTQVLDQRGNRLKVTDIKANADVTIDAIPHGNGYRIIKIILITDKGV